jgi:hypothetical protein
MVCSQPLGQWILRYFLGEVLCLSASDWVRLIQSGVLFLMGVLLASLQDFPHPKPHLEIII